MTAREIGNGLNRMSRRGRRPGGTQTVAGRKKEKISAAERRHLGQLVVCAVIFVSIVAARLLLPQKMERLSDSLRGTLGQSMDVQEVFSAVGRVVSGEESVSDSWGDVYQAVFGPEEDAAVETAAQTTVAVPEKLVRKGRPVTDPPAAAASETDPLPASAVATGAETTQETKPPADPAPAPTGGDLSAVTLVYSNLPKNVCLEQQILGFSYTSPVVGPLSSPFGYREHPIEGEEKFHYGVDLAVDEGTAIASFADGTVTAVGESSSLGKYVIVEHENGYSTLYAHCSKVTVSSGAAVKKGGKLAEAGQTGLATGPHCHFELHRDSNYLNPVYYVQTA